MTTTTPPREEPPGVTWADTDKLKALEGAVLDAAARLTAERARHEKLREAEADYRDWAWTYYWQDCHVRCRGRTKLGERCMHKGGDVCCEPWFCFQHKGQDGGSA